MAEKATYNRSTDDEDVIDLDSKRSTSDYSDGDGGGTTLDTETRRYVDKSMDTVKAQNDARFTRIETKLDNIKMPNIWQLISLAAASIITLVGVIGVMADRFDGGLAASSLINEVTRVQAVRDDAQDAKLDEILGVVKVLYGQSQEGPPEGQN